MVSVAVWVLRRAAPAVHRPFRTPWMPWVPKLGAGICLAQMAEFPLTTWIRLVAWLAVGFVIYFASGRRNADRHRPLRGGPAAAPASRR